jgi:tetratricopeptide (TPR) repeat protein
MRTVCCVLVLVVVAALAIPASAQLSALYGKITGEDGKPLTNATVVIANNDSGRQYSMKTDKKGEFVAVNIPVGMYHVTITQDGKVVYEAQGKAVKAEGDLNIDLAKEKAAAKERGLQGLSAEQKKKMAEEQAAAEKQQQNVGSMNELLAKAKTSSDAGDFPGAIASIKQAIQIDSSQALLWGRLGEIYLLAGSKSASDRQAATEDYNQAADAYKKAVSLAPSEATYHNNLGQALAKMGKTDEAAAEYTTAAQLDPAHAGTYYFNLGAILTNTGKIDEANAAFDKALAADPTRTEAYYWKGVNLLGKATLDKSGKMVAPPGAGENLRKYLEADPSGRYASNAKEMLTSIGEKVETTYTKGKNK